MIKDDFPYFKNNSNIYLDSAATSQKPYKVIEAITEYYTHYCANTHRGSYEDGNRATLEYENAREYISQFVKTHNNRELTFTKGVTEGINMVAHSFVDRSYDSVIISSLEHHSNITPWHLQGRSPGNGLEVIRYNKNLTLDMDHLESLLNNKRKNFLSITHISNAFGIIHPIEEIVELAHRYDTPVLVDGAQALSRVDLNLKDLEVDFYSLSAHKCYGPTGVGALYIHEQNLDRMRPYQSGGAMIDNVTFEHSTLLDAPLKFEAGTQNIAGAIGFRAALEYVNSVGYDYIQKKEINLIEKIYNGLKGLNGIVLYTDPEDMAGNISFNIESLQPIDVGILLDKQHVAVRSGHHCAMPIMQKLGIDGTVRLSLGLYSDENDVEIFLQKLQRAIQILRG